MTSVSVEAHSHGDGWLCVDTQEWIEDRGEYASDLTKDLRGWMDDNDDRWPDEDVIAAWITARTGERPVGLHGDGEMWVHNLANFSDHMLEDIGFVVLSSAGLGDLMITVSDDLGLCTAPTVYRSMVDSWEEWASYSNADGECVNGHQWCTHNTVHLHAFDSTDMTAYRVPDLVRVPFDDRDRTYVACPSCGKAVRFICRF